ncbi:MAG: hypothetical protein PHW62_01630 [Candidatus Ratteibacteria bacterium]|nr:hypothetical protein [Candidatus Ratteibacteria bacterium]
MSYIEKTWSFETLPHIFLIDDKFKLIDLGWYDPAWGVETEITYKPGKFVNELNEIWYDDRQYKDKQCLVVDFKHPILGNYPVLRKVGRGHHHIKYIVSKNAIRAYDVMEKAESGDLFIYASLAHNPVVTKIHEPYDELPTNTQESLIEIIPHLTAEELEKLSKDINFVTSIKEMYQSAESKKHELVSQNYILKARVVASDGVVMQLQSYVDTLLKSYQWALDKVIGLQLSIKEKTSQGISMVEGEYNLGVPWDNIDAEDMSKTAAIMQSDIRAISSMMQKDGGMAESQKQILAVQFLNVVGVDWMKRFMYGSDPRTIVSPLGNQSMTITQNPTPLELYITKAQLFQNNRMSEEDFKRASVDFLTAMRDQFKVQEPNSAVETLKQGLIRQISPPQEGQHATTR